jgi:hypothetical protein
MYILYTNDREHMLIEELHDEYDTALEYGVRLAASRQTAVLVAPCTLELADRLIWYGRLIDWQLRDDGTADLA